MDDAGEVKDAPDVPVSRTLGRYGLRGVLGNGAMGRVYRGVDPALGREVAIKALAEVGDGPSPEAHRRFEREARLLATLNHPNIAGIYGWEEIGGAPYLILELVEGETLAERLREGPMPVAEAVAVAHQLTLALEEAHRKGVVHRDLKPSNVMLGPGGQIKVLDFGIAKALADDQAKAADAAPTTGEGVVLGTAPYMSPEQVRAEAVDRRSDIWSFGCLLYEMLSGKRAFAGRSRAEIVASVLRDEPDWTALPAGVPAGLRRLLRRCLRRERNERLQDIGDARMEIGELDDEDSSSPPPAAAVSHKGYLLLAALLALGLALAIALPRREGRVPSPPVVRLSLDLPAGVTLPNDYASPFAVSPDGSMLAVLALRDGTARIYLRRIDGTEMSAVRGTEGAWQPTFSPDGRSLAFFADRKLKTAPLAGGPGLVLAETSANPRGASWSADGTIVFAASQTAGLMRVDAGGGSSRPLTRLDLSGGDGSHRWPQVLPGGQWVLFTCGVDGAPFDDAHLDAISLVTGERRRLLSGGSQGRYASGRLFFTRAGRLFAVPFDLDRIAVNGRPELLVEGVRDDPRNGGAHFAVADGGPLIYGPAAPRATETYMAWVDPAGALTRIADTPRQFREPRLSPDGRRVAVRIGSEGASALWVFDVERATLTRASGKMSVYHPIWTPDGRRITVASHRLGGWKLHTLESAGGGTASTVYEGPDRMYPNAWTPDGKSLLFQQRRAGTGWDLRIVDVGPDGRAVGPARDLAATPSQESSASVSSDGRFMAYDSDELDGVFGVYVAPVETPDAHTRATKTIARWPRWGAGTRLYCWYPMRAQPGDSGIAEGLHHLDWRATGSPARTVPLWSDARRAAPLLRRLAVANYATYDVDVSARGPRFLVLETSAPTTEPSLQRPVVVLNWPRPLRPPIR